MLQFIPIPSSIDKIPIPDPIRENLLLANERIEAFQDCWRHPQYEQFVAADYQHVYQALAWILDSQPRIGNRFLEWGCGFAVVSALASTFGLDVIGIEAEHKLFEQGQRTIQDWQQPVELIQGNFLPPGAAQLADDPTLPSLGHPCRSAYDQIDSSLDDFAVVYAYPWPGEDQFHESVFDHHAAVGALLIFFCGPNDIRLYRKTS